MAIAKPKQTLAVVVCGLVLLLLLASIAAAAEVPFARIGKASSQPEYHDGKFKAFGWRQATAFCGMRDANLPGTPFTGRDASWWLTYDKDALYIATMIVLAPQGEHFLAATTTDNDPAIFADDHLLVQVALDPRVGEAGVPYLRLAVNPAGAVWASTMEALPGQHHPVDVRRISYGNHVGTGHVPGHWWYSRLRIPLDVLGVDSLDGLDGRLHLAWSTPPMHLSWGGVKPAQWDTAPRVHFDPEPRAGMWLNGSYPRLLSLPGGTGIDLNVSTYAGGADEPLLFTLALRNVVDGETTWQHDWQQEFQSGKRERYSARGHIVGAAPTGNTLLIEAATTLAGDRQVLLSSAVPYGLDDPAVSAALENWQQRHAYEPQAEATFDYVYNPYTERLDALINRDLNPDIYSGEQRAKAERIVAADRLQVRVLDTAGKVLATGSGTVAEADGHAVLQLPQPLPEGTYTVEFELLAGEQPADRKTLELVRKYFEWEKNDLGRDAVIIPPWTPIRAAEQTLHCWGRTYRLAPTGLPAAIVSQDSAVLGAPIRLVAGIDGQQTTATGNAPQVSLVPGKIFPADFAGYELTSNTCPVAGEDFDLEATNGYAAQVKAESQMGALRATLDGRFDYDGLYTVRLTLAADQPVTVETLTMVVPLASAGLYRFQRLTEMESLGAIPDGEGVLVGSSELGEHGAIAGTFVPVVFVGDYDHGFWWLAESDRGWSIDDDQDQVQLVRENGSLALRFRFIARPTVIDAPRTIEFAIVASPTRPKAVGYHQAFWAGKRTHDTAGFRFWGGGVNGFQLYEPEDYEALRSFLYESNGISRHYYDPDDAPPGHKTYYKVRNETAKQGYPVTLYGCSWGANAGMRSFPTYGSAWTHTARTLETHTPHTQFMNWTNFGGTAKWDTPAELTPVYTLMDDSFVDCWLWHMVRLGKYSIVNGCFFDCFEPLPRRIGARVRSDVNGLAYRRADGRLQAFANPLRYHRRTRRYATALWLAGRPPSLLNSNNFDNTYGPTWFVEGPMYHDEVGEDLISQGVTPDKAAAYTASLSGMGFARSDVRVAAPGTLTPEEDHCFAVLIAYGILHDLPWAGTPSWHSANMKAVNAVLREDLEIGRPGVRHLRYWRADERPGVGDPRVLAGGFVHADRANAVIAILNPTTEAIATTVTLPEHLLGRPVTAVTGVLSGKELAGAPEITLDLPAHGVHVLLCR